MYYLLLFSYCYLFSMYLYVLIYDIFISMYLLLIAIYKLKFPFWSRQPVFHFHNLKYWLFPPGIIQHGKPEKGTNPKLLIIEDSRYLGYMNFLVPPPQTVIAQSRWEKPTFSQKWIRANETINDSLAPINSWFARDEKGNRCCTLLPPGAMQMPSHATIMSDRAVHAIVVPSRAVHAVQMPSCHPMPACHQRAISRTPCHHGIRACHPCRPCHNGNVCSRKL